MSIREIAAEIDSRFNSLNDVPVRDVRLTREEWALIRPHISDCRAALTKKYVPMTDAERNEMMARWYENHKLPSISQYIEAEVIRRAGLEVQE